jgi:hypothetical protein
MPREEVVEVCGRVVGAGERYWLDGGWAASCHVASHVALAWFSPRCFDASFRQQRTRACWRQLRRAERQCQDISASTALPGPPLIVLLGEG